MFWFKKKQNIPKQEVRRLTQEEVNEWYGYQMELEKEYSKLYWEYEKLKGSYSKLTGFEYQEEFIKESIELNLQYLLPNIPFKKGTEAYTNDYANQSLPMKCKEDEIEIERLQKNIAKLKEQLANLKQD
jgi:CRISPR/Cas system-associated protein Cas5 (RAMP superfamily)